MTKKAYEDMTIEELEGELHRLGEERATIRGEAKQVHVALDGKMAERDAERLAATLSDDQKRALLQKIGAEGIASEEAVGTPGAVSEG